MEFKHAPNQRSDLFILVMKSCLNVPPHFSLLIALTKRLQLLNSFFPHRFNVDACKAPFRGDLDEIRSLETVWKDIAGKLCMVKQVLAVCKVPRPAGGINHEFLYKCSLQANGSHFSFKPDLILCMESKKQNKTQNISAHGTPWKMEKRLVKEEAVMEATEAVML